MINVSPKEACCALLFFIFLVFLANYGIFEGSIWRINLHTENVHLHKIPGRKCSAYIKQAQHHLRRSTKGR